MSQPGADNHAQTRYNHGRLNHLEAEAVQKTPGMKVRMFLVKSHLVEVLFDTGATHSFITASWVEAHNLPTTTMATPSRLPVKAALSTFLFRTLIYCKNYMDVSDV